MDSEMQSILVRKPEIYSGTICSGIDLSPWDQVRDDEALNWHDRPFAMAQTGLANDGANEENDEVNEDEKNRVNDFEAMLNGSGLETPSFEYHGWRVDSEEMDDYYNNHFPVHNGRVISSETHDCSTNPEPQARRPDANFLNWGEGCEEEAFDPASSKYIVHTSVSDEGGRKIIQEGLTRKRITNFLEWPGEDHTMIRKEEHALLGASSDRGDARIDDDSSSTFENDSSGSVSKPGSHIGSTMHTPVHLDAAPLEPHRTILGRSDDGLPITYEEDWISKGRKIMHCLRHGVNQPARYRDYEIFNREGWAIVDDPWENPRDLGYILGVLEQEQRFDEWWAARSPDAEPRDQNPVEADYTLFFNALDGTIVVNSMHNRCSSPDHLNRFSDVCYLGWKEACKRVGTVPGSLKYMIQQMVQNSWTRKIIIEALKKHGEVVSPFPGYSFDPESEAGLMILGSPNGHGAGFLIMDHKEDFGTKTVSKITVCHQENEPQSFIIIFAFEEATPPVTYEVTDKSRL